MDRRQKDIARVLRKKQSLIKDKFKKSLNKNNKAGGMPMKKAIFFILFCYLIFCFGFSENIKNHTIVGSNFKYSIQYPESWQKIEAYGFLQLVGPSNQPAKYKPNVFVMVKDLNSVGNNWQEYENIWEKFTAQELEDFVILDKGKTILNGKQAYYYIYSGKKDGIVFRCKRYSIQDDSNVYELTFEDREETFDFNLETAEFIMQSFKIEK